MGERYDPRFAGLGLCNCDMDGKIGAFRHNPFPIGSIDFIGCERSRGVLEISCQQVLGEKHRLICAQLKMNYWVCKTYCWPYPMQWNLGQCPRQMVNLHFGWAPVLWG
jgi:hypothetical protein